ncbi:MAG: hypothetical protein P1V20_17280 [Verrucomicrobiales bacterium]|nr:hypothetical protein [Verrucomicrobiales bacterium]
MRFSVLLGFAACLVTLVIVFALFMGSPEEVEAGGGEFRISLSPRQTAAVNVDSIIDDSHYRDPYGYQVGEVHGRYVQSVKIENTGRRPLINTGLIVNDRDISSMEGLREYINPEGEDRNQEIRSLYDFWIDHRVHSTSDTPENQNPFSVLNYFGCTLCTDDTSALIQLAAGVGIRSRRFRLNGHALAEYYFDDKWNILDGDTKVVYRMWDNRRNASYSDLCRDPFLGIRTKVYGRNRVYDFAESWQATSVFELAQPEKPVEIPIDPTFIVEPLKKGWDLYPGEAFIYHNDKVCPVAIGTPGAIDDRSRKVSLAVVEWQINGERRNSPDGIRLKTPNPIYQIVDQQQRPVMDIDTRRPVYAIEIPPEKCSASMTVYCQAARLSLPLLGKGHNSIGLVSSSRSGDVMVTYQLNPVGPEFTLPVARIDPDGCRLNQAEPEFSILSDAGVDKLWWQISDNSGFGFLIPNFDNVGSATEQIKLSKIDSTFLSRGTEYFIRVKARKKGVWGEWSAPYLFRVSKPVRPVNLRLSGGVLTWDSCGDNVEYLIFGSDRLDFVPDIYTDVEICEMRKENFEILKSRPNQNLLGRTVDSEFAVREPFLYYRVIAIREGVYSTPSDLLRVQEGGVNKIPKVLQTRWRKEENPQAPLGYDDIYHALELEAEDR